MISGLKEGSEGLEREYYTAVKISIQTINYPKYLFYYFDHSEQLQAWRKRWLVVEFPTCDSDEVKITDGDDLEYFFCKITDDDWEYLFLK